MTEDRIVIHIEGDSIKRETEAAIRATEAELNARRRHLPGQREADSAEPGPRDEGCVQPVAEDGWSH